MKRKLSAFAKASARLLRSFSEGEFRRMSLYGHGLGLFSIEAGLIFLIIFTPLAFGTVGFGSITILELVIFFLVIIWLLKGAHLTKTPLTLSLFFFLSLILFQLYPLPPKILSYISPSTYSLYKMTIPDYNLASPWRSLSVYWHATYLEFFKVLAYTGTFFIVINNLKDQRQIHRFILVIIFMGFFEASYGLLEYLSRHQHIFFLQKKYYTNAVTGTYINKNHFAGYLEMVSPFCLGLLIFQIKGFVHLAKTQNLRLFFKPLLLIFIMATVSFAFILSRSRMGILGLVFALVFTLFILIIEKTNKMPLRILVIVVGLALLVSFPLITFLRGMPLDKGRLQQYKDTVNLIREFPLFGTGLGTYAYIYPAYKTIKTPQAFSHTHNDYLELLSETGIIGLAILILGIGHFLCQMVKAWFKTEDYYRKCIGLSGLTAMGLILFHSLFDFNLHIPANAFLFVVIMGLTWNLLLVE